MGDFGKSEVRVLALDDEESILSLYRSILRTGSDKTRYDLTLCREAEQAIQAIRDSLTTGNPICLAFVDIHLASGPDGIWAAEQIRKIDPDVHIVLATGQSDVDLGQISRRIPPPDKLLYLQKPFRVQEILQCAAAMGAKWHMERDYRERHERLEAAVERRTSALSDEIKNRRSIEEALRRSEEQFRTIISHNADAMLILDEQGAVRFLNPAAESLFGCNSNSFIGEAFGFPLDSGERAEIEIVRADNSVGVAEMQVVETEWSGNRAFLASLRDTTERKHMENRLQESLDQVQKAMKGTVQAMAQTVEKRDPYTSGHQLRVATIARAIAEETRLSEDRKDGVYMAGIVHDLGKISIPAEILSKPTRLSEVEFSLIKTHPQVGADILKGIEFPWPIAQMVLQHHEREDGSGYPNGLKSDDVLFEAKIIAVADVVEAIASHRPYRPALGLDTATNEITENRGRLYSPEAVDACLKICEEGRLGI